MMISYNQNIKSIALPETDAHGTVNTIVVHDDIESEYFDIQDQVERFLGAGGHILACGTCLESRNKEGSLICPVSSMQDLMDIVEESDNFTTF